VEKTDLTGLVVHNSTEPNNQSLSSARR